MTRNSTKANATYHFDMFSYHDFTHAIRCLQFPKVLELGIHRNQTLRNIFLRHRKKGSISKHIMGRSLQNDRLRFTTPTGWKQDRYHLEQKLQERNQTFLKTNWDILSCSRVFSLGNVNASTHLFIHNIISSIEIGNTHTHTHTHLKYCRTFRKPWSNKSTFSGCQKCLQAIQSSYMDVHAFV